MLIKNKEIFLPFQRRATNYIVERNNSMCWIDMALGKTIIALTASDFLLDTLQCRGVLVISTVKIVEGVWPAEVEEWEHTRWMRTSLVRGTPKQRLDALLAPAEIYLTNYEQITWLTRVLKKHWIGRGLKLPFDIVIFDEVSKMKDATSHRTSNFMDILTHFKYRIGLTGTPATNGYIDLHGQYLVLDGGVRLGPSKSNYRKNYFIHNEYTRKYNLRRNAAAEIRARVSDITLQLSGKERMQLPPVRDTTIKLSLPDKLQKIYDKFMDDFFIQVNGRDVESLDSSARSMKCRQLANGAVFTTDEGRRTDVWEEFHTEKLDALSELIDTLGGEPLLLYYNFRHDKERIAKRFPETVFLDSKSNVAEVIKLWSAGRIKILSGHYLSMAHGLNLQHGGHHLCHFGVPWDLEWYMQALARLARPGQKHHTVFNHRIVMRGTIETDVILDVLAMKGATQDDLRLKMEQLQNARIRNARPANAQVVSSGPLR